ncbi:MAG: hypothetical protein U0807_15435 [Candidatus Binatia bacterium]
MPAEREGDPRPTGRSPQDEASPASAEESWRRQTEILELVKHIHEARRRRGRGVPATPTR